MMNYDRDAIICDLAETYHIYDFRSFSIAYIATLVIGLSDNSRIKRNLNGMKVGIDTALLAGMTDRLSMLLWTQSVDGQKGRNRPDSIYETLMGKELDKKDVRHFESAEAFQKAWDDITKGGS